jgi:pimeloyl-ACP methyl ester carboxylesterase
VDKALKQAFYVLIVILFFQTVSASEKVFILVPGFFNSSVPAPQKNILDPWDQPYFSKEIISVFLKSNYKVYIAKNLNPVGSLDENAKLLVQFLDQVPCDHCEMQIIAHSAGGLYSLKALTLKKFPVKKLITLSTPFAGLQFLDHFRSDAPGLDSVLKFICLENLQDLTAAHVKDFMKTIKVQQPLQLFMFAGFQKTSIFFNDWNNLSWPLIFFQNFMSEGSDGIVTVQSSLAGAQYNVATVVQQSVVPIEHWEMIADQRFFSAIGVWNYPQIGQAQEKLYQYLIGL